MYAGASTHLTSLLDGVFELETRIDHRKRTVPVAQLIRNIARSWHRNPELAACHSCRVRVYQSAGPTGFAIPAKGCREPERPGSDAFENAAWEAVQRIREAASLPAPLIAGFTIPLDPSEEPDDPADESPG